MTGALMNIDICGKGGITLARKAARGPAPLPQPDDDYGHGSAQVPGYAALHARGFAGSKPVDMHMVSS